MVPEIGISGHKTRAVFKRHNIVSDGDRRETAKTLGAFTQDGKGKRQDQEKP